MEKLKFYLVKHFEKFLVLILTLAIVAVNYLLPQKATFLSFYYLPALVAGYFLGRRYAIYTSVFSILLGVFIVILNPASFYPQPESWHVALDIIVWAGFLLLASFVVGTLYQHKDNKIRELKEAYTGVLEILTKYIDSFDPYTKGHASRVAELCSQIAFNMKLPASEVENIRVAGLLHDIGKIEMSCDLIQKSVNLTEKEKQALALKAEKSVEILDSVRGVLKEAVPIVLSYHTFFVKEKFSEAMGFENLPLGARILAVADHFDAMTVDTPIRKGKPYWQAIQELEKGSGKTFDPDMVSALKTVMVEKEELTTSA